MVGGGAFAPLSLVFIGISMVLYTKTENATDKNMKTTAIKGD